MIFSDVNRGAVCAVYDERVIVLIAFFCIFSIIVILLFEVHAYKGKQ